MSEGLSEAIGKLEAAVERLAEVARGVAEERAARARGDVEPAGVPPAEVAALSARLEATIARLRAALPEGAEAGAEVDELGLPEDGAEDGTEDGADDALDESIDETGRGGTASGAPRGAGEG
ncbi:hypothetical protein D9599_00560 [Roseomonas sp. KE2513]|uniref:hypothetical protein n=1 Tax=Roseomonas sp. KE2513 TaxID=2479202 RepID=UPI0018DFA8A6|nr:hypothetical protein [Roseomonas sp. KE2513]MBI0534068.1 hypothetical protein [Roseomonas sp. KE2513]